MRESIIELAQVLSKVLERFANAICDFAKTFVKTHHNIYGSELRCKRTHGYSGYKCSKPNTKPYSVFKRLYRVQARR